MSYEVFLKGRIIDKSGNGIANLPVFVKTITSNDPIRGIKTTSTYASGTTGGAGDVMFSGVAANTYDIWTVHPSGTFKLENLVVKNEFIVVPGGSEAIYEQRTFIRSQDSVGASGIVAQYPLSPVWIREGNINYARPAESGINSGYVTNTWENRLDGTLYSGTVMMQKEFGDRQYHSNQNIFQTSTFTLRILT
jgi:hypothetical protein